jgi:hypothetical protein
LRISYLEIRKIKILKSDRKTPEELFGFINN